MKKNIGFAITGSFCTHKTVLETLKTLKSEFNILPIVSESVKKMDTRFGKAEDFLSNVEKICENKIVSTIQDAEKVGPNNLVDIVVIAPCTGNTLAKLATGISDNAVTMVTKSHIRNNKPVVVAISTNDALGTNLKNLAFLLNSKNFFFVPFGQDDYEKKPKSLVADWTKLKDTINCAFDGKQIEPLLTK